MNSFTRVFFGVLKAVTRGICTFPATIINAMAFTVVVMIRIQLDWPEQEAYNFLLNCLHWAFALGAIFCLAAITLVYSRFNQAKFILMANLSCIAVLVAAFSLLWIFGGTETGFSNMKTISTLAAARVSVAILISTIAFIVLAGYPKEQSDFARSFFMIHKAFVIALIYGLVILGGLSGVARVVQALLYHGMSSKVFMYIGALTGFIAFTIFVGYFPDFHRGQHDQHREVAQKQPRFIEILFGYIIIPIVLALTVVLLIWAGKTVVTNSWPSFVRLSSIATAYVAGGIWLHVMVTHYDSPLAVFYRRVYPITTLIILVFEAWALVIQLGKSGLKTTEYFFILTWIFSGAAAILLLINREKAHLVIVSILCALAIFSVIPTVGYYVLPVTAQVQRLEKLLVSNGMLKNQKLVPAKIEPSAEVRESITDAVSFLAYVQDAKLPTWYEKDLSDESVFKEKLGFEQKWPEVKEYDKNPTLGTYLTLPAGVIDISGYRWSVELPENLGKEAKSQLTFNGDRGSYLIDWNTNTKTGIPFLKIKLGDRVILEQDMTSYLEQIAKKFPPNQSESHKADANDLSLKLECPELMVLLVFNNISINMDTFQDTINYWLTLDSIYLYEKP